MGISRFSLQAKASGFITTIWLLFHQPRSKHLNNPSFNLSTQEEIGSKAEDSLEGKQTERFLRTKLTLSPKQSQKWTSSSQSLTIPTKCLLHKNTHPPCKCRAFSKKPVEVGKSFLKGNHLRFKCCSSFTLHVAKKMCSQNSVHWMQWKASHSASLWSSTLGSRSKPSIGAWRGGWTLSSITGNYPVHSSLWCKSCW